MVISNSLQNDYMHLATMKRINSAADDAAGLAISQKLTSQINGYDTGTDNALSMNDLGNTAEGALASIGDNLQRIRELAVQASNGTMGDDDKKMIQDEIDQLKGQIGDVTQYTEFNTQKLLDGTFTNKNIAISPSGTGMTMSIQDTSLQTLGIDSFNVTGSFDISDIDNAISKVTDARSNLGAVSNRIMSAVNVNRNASENLTAAESRISDLDPETELMQMSTQQVLQQYQIFAQQQKSQQQASMLNLLG